MMGNPQKATFVKTRSQNDSNKHFFPFLKDDQSHYKTSAFENVGIVTFLFRSPDNLKNSRISLKKDQKPL